MWAAGAVSIVIMGAAMVKVKIVEVLVVDGKGSQWWDWLWYV